MTINPAPTTEALNNAIEVIVAAKFANYTIDDLEWDLSVYNSGFINSALTIADKEFIDYTKSQIRKNVMQNINMQWLTTN